MSKYFQPERRPAVVTGASSGIGAATALCLAEAGFPVALGARRTDKCEEVATAIREAGGEAFVHALDITDSDAPSMPRSRSIVESASAIEQNGARPSRVATRQNVCAR